MFKTITSATKSLTALFADAFVHLIKNDPLRMAGATAFFTTFALPPILIIITQFLGLFVGPEEVRSHLYETLSGTLGASSIEQIVGVISEMKSIAQNQYAVIVGIIFLLFVATTLFKVIKGSVNQVWKIREVKKRRLWKTLWERVRSVLVIMVAGLLFGFGLLVEGIQAILGRYMELISPLLSTYFNSLLNYAISVVIVSIWFAVLFRYIPAARPKWRIALAGGFFTSILFTLGKILLGWMLAASNINTIYGASGSIVLLLLFVFYSSLILYYGASFTRTWSIYKKNPIRPLAHATHYEIQEVGEV